MQDLKVNVIQPKNKIDLLDKELNPVKKRVAAYARVSTDNDEQKTSIEAQIDEYAKQIKNNSEWEFVEIYADEGISGTSTKKRKEFNRMINDAKKGKFDLILTKSISRFARNTVDCLNYIRDLRSINVEIYFEKENIYSFDSKVDFMLTIMSSIAQEEARNISENIKWNVRKRFREGVPIINHNRLLGYTKDKKGGNLVVLSEEAEIVRLIFELYIGGLGPSGICRELTKRGHKTGAGKTKWQNSTITTILKNEKYAGDLLQQKTLTVDYLTHKKVRNNDVAPKYLTKDNHEAIIDRKTFELAQQIRHDRAKTKIGENKDLNKYTHRYPFSSFVVCKHCGRTLKRRYWNYGTPAQKVMMQCGSYLEGKGNCSAKALHHEILEGTTLQVINEMFLKNSDVIPTLTHSITDLFDVNQTNDELNQTRAHVIEIENEISALIDLKIKNNYISQESFDSKYQHLSDELIKQQAIVKKLESKYMTDHESFQKLSTMKALLKQQKDGITEFDAQTLRVFLYRAIAVSPSEIVFVINNKMKYSDDEFAADRFKIIDLPGIAEGTYHSDKYGKLMTYKIVMI